MGVTGNQPPSQPLWGNLLRDPNPPEIRSGKQAPETPIPAPVLPAGPATRFLILLRCTCAVLRYERNGIRILSIPLRLPRPQRGFRHEAPRPSGSFRVSFLVRARTRPQITNRRGQP